MINVSASDIVMLVKLFDVSISVAAFPEERNISCGTGFQLANELLLYKITPLLPTAIALDVSNI